MWNLDETGSSPWKESKERKVIIQNEIKDFEIHEKVKRKINHQSLIVAIWGNENTATRIILSSDSHSIDIQKRRSFV